MLFVGVGCAEMVGGDGLLAQGTSRACAMHSLIKGCASAVKSKKKDAPQHVPIILQSYNPTILFHNLHLRHLITLTNLVDHIQSFYHAAEARVVAVEVGGVVARVANEKL